MAQSGAKHTGQGLTEAKGMQDVDPLPAPVWKWDREPHAPVSVSGVAGLGGGAPALHALPTRSQPSLSLQLFFQLINRALLSPLGPSGCCLGLNSFPSVQWALPQALGGTGRGQPGTQGGRQDLAGRVKSLEGEVGLGALPPGRGTPPGVGASASCQGKPLRTLAARSRCRHLSNCFRGNWLLLPPP